MKTIAQRGETNMNIKNPLSEVIKIETVNTGGGCMVDLIHLDGGQVIAVNEECICLYESEDQFWEAYSDAPCIER